MPYRQAEAEASILRCWSPLLVPGVLQCESYMRAVLSVEPYTAERLGELVSARLERQSVIGRAYLTAWLTTTVATGPEAALKPRGFSLDSALYPRRRG